jgi:hypothetical protein
MSQMREPFSFGNDAVTISHRSDEKREGPRITRLRAKLRRGRRELTRIFLNLSGALRSAFRVSRVIRGQI